MKTKACHCCEGSGRELDHKEVGAAMRALRKKKGLTLKQTGRRMSPRLHVTYLSDLERGNRNWNLSLVAQYEKICA